MKKLFVPTFIALCALGSAFAAHCAPEFPGDRPVTLVVPFSPGGGTDILARLVASRLGALIHQSVIVDNKPGANGVVASQFVEHAKPDGYTLMFGSSSTQVLAPLLSPNKNEVQDERKNFEMVSIVAETPLALAVNATSGIRSLDSFLKLARERELTFGSFGTGSSPHLMGELLAAKTNIRLMHVPYKGSSPAITDLLGNHIDSVFLTVAAISNFVEDKQVIALAVTGARRTPSLPGVPTFKEAGILGLEESGWFAIFAPTGTPAALIESLHDDIGHILATADMQAKLVELGLQRSNASRTEATGQWERSIASTQEALKQVKLEPNQ